MVFEGETTVRLHKHHVTGRVNNCTIKCNYLKSDKMVNWLLFPESPSGTILSKQ